MRGDIIDRQNDWAPPPALLELPAREETQSGWRKTVAILFALSPGIVFLANVVIYSLLRN